MDKKFKVIREVYADDILLVCEDIDEYRVYETFDKAREALNNYILRGESMVWDSFLKHSISVTPEEFLKNSQLMDVEKVGPYSALNRYVQTISIQGGSSKRSPRFTETHIIQEVEVK